MKTQEAIKMQTILMFKVGQAKWRIKVTDLSLFFSVQVVLSSVLVLCHDVLGGLKFSSSNVYLM